jgi:hypothetical protein
MKIDKDQIAETFIAGKTKDGKNIVYVATHGGLHAFFCKDENGDISAIGAAPHKSIAKFLAEKKESGIKWNEELDKSEELGKMSRPQITFPFFPKTSTRPDQEVQPIETKRQKDLYGKRVANAQLKDLDQKQVFRLSGSATKHTKQSGLDAAAKTISNKFDRNTLGLNAPTPHGPKSAALVGKLRSKFEEGDDDYQQKLTEHAQKKKEIIKDYNLRYNDWYKKMYAASLGDNKEEHERLLREKPKKPRMPRKPSKEKKETTELTPEKQKERGRAVDSTIYHEGFHNIMSQLERHYGKEQAKKIHSGLLSNFSRDALVSVGSFITDVYGYNPKSPKFTEEILAHARDILVNPVKRKKYKEYAKENAEKNIKEIKQGHQKAYEWAKKIKPEDTNKSEEEQFEILRKFIFSNTKKAENKKSSDIYVVYNADLNEISFMKKSEIIEGLENKTLSPYALAKEINGTEDAICLLDLKKD